MRLDGRRESRNVRDIRGKGGKAAGLGLGGLVIVGIITWLMGGNPLDVVRQAGGLEAITGSQQTEYVPTAEEEALAKFSRQILAGTEDVWTAEFRRMGLEYEPPTLVLSPEACSQLVEVHPHHPARSTAPEINRYISTSRSSRR